MKNNIILHKFQLDSSNFNFIETIPDFVGNYDRYSLTIDTSGILQWNPYNFINLPSAPKSKGEYFLNFDDLGNLDWIKKKSTDIDLSNFITSEDLNHVIELIPEIPEIKPIDLSSFITFKNLKEVIKLIPKIPEYDPNIFLEKDKLQSGLHIGDSVHGFTFGNGTNQGFIPQIVGMGSDDSDPGLYFIGKSLDDVSSNIPVIVFDGRDKNNNSIENRPIFGITNNGINSDFKFIVDQFGKVGIGKNPKHYKLEVNGTIEAKDLIIDEYSIKDLVNVIRNQQDQIDELKKIIKTL